MKACNGLDKAHPHNGGQSALHKVNADLNVIRFYKSTFPDTPGIMSEQVPRCRGPVELTHNTIHQTWMQPKAQGRSLRYRDAAVLDTQEGGSEIGWM